MKKDVLTKENSVICRNTTSWDIRGAVISMSKRLLKNIQSFLRSAEDLSGDGHGFTAAACNKTQFRSAARVTHAWSDSSAFRCSHREMPPPPRNMLDCHFNVFLRRGRNKSGRRMTSSSSSLVRGAGSAIGIPRVRLRRPRAPNLVF